MACAVPMVRQFKCCMSTDDVCAKKERVAPKSCLSARPACQQSEGSTTLSSKTSTTSTEALMTATMPASTTTIVPGAADWYCRKPGATSGSYRQSQCTADCPTGQILTVRCCQSASDKCRNVDKVGAVNCKNSVPVCIQEVPSPTSVMIITRSPTATDTLATPTSIVAPSSMSPVGPVTETASPATPGVPTVSYHCRVPGKTKGVYRTSNCKLACRQPTAIQFWCCFTSTDSCTNDYKLDVVHCSASPAPVCTI